MPSLKEPLNEAVSQQNGALNEHDKPYKVAISEVPITEKRKPYVPGPEAELIDAGTARATLAASQENPEGTKKDNWAARHQHQTVIQQHVDYFDRDQDGIIWPVDTWRAFRDWQFIWPLALFATFIIHAALSYATMPGLLPDPFFRIIVANVHRNKHGSDSMTFDAEGRFRPQHFEDFFAKYDKDNKKGLTKGDIATALRGQAFAWDFFGCSAAFLEWTATYLLLWPQDGVMKKDDVRRVMDGSIFYEKAEKYKKRELK